MEPREIYGWIIRLAFIAAAAAVLYYFLFYRRADFVITVRNGRVQYQGAVALAQQRAITDFLLLDLGLKGPARIMGARNRGRLQIWFRGPLSQGEKQRIRNFMLTR